MTRIAALLMVKNEADRICTTIESVRDVVDCIILFDTGSSDNTIAAVQAAAGATIPVFVKLGEFVDFATSRNEAFDFANTLTDVCDYFLVLDSNDELFDGASLRSSILTADAYFVERRLKQAQNSVLSFHDVKLFRAPCKFRFKGAVHECLDLDGGDIRRLPDGIAPFIFQDRTIAAEIAKSNTRWRHDLDLLKRERKQHPSDPRPLFYLAQTYACIGAVETNPEQAIMFRRKAYEHYLSFLARPTNGNGAIDHDRIAALLMAGQLAEKLGERSALDLYMDAAAESRETRVEPLTCATRILNSKRLFRAGFALMKIACNLPTKCDQMLCGIERRVYDYDRWHLMGVCACFEALAETDVVERVRLLKVGLDACDRALQVGLDVETDAKNKACYENNLRSLGM